MSRFRVLLLLLIVSLLGALNNGRAIWWGFAGAILALLLIAIAWAWTGINWLRLARRTNTRVAQAGQELEEEFKLTNLSLVPKLWVEIRDQSTLPAHYASRVVGLIGGSQWRGWRTKTRCALRGRYYLGPVEVRSGDPLGIYQMRRKIDITNTLLVYPATVELRSFPLPAIQLPDGDSMRRRTHHVTTNAAGVRDYVHGDSINRIHWPTSARRQRLMVKEFELDPVSDVWIALDLNQHVHVGSQEADAAALTLSDPTDGQNGSFRLPASTEEYVISIAASCARYFLQQNRALGMMMHGAHRHALNSERGERQFTKMMETLAVIRADGEIPFGRVLAAEAVSLPRGITIIAISSSLDAEWGLAVQSLVRSGLRVVALFVDASSFGAGDRDNAEVLAALSASGAIVRSIRYGDALDTALQ
jgi:uncharacterized protein (DUF58 family)